MSDSVTPRTVARQAPLPMGFPRQEFWSGFLLRLYFVSYTKHSITAHTQKDTVSNAPENSMTVSYHAQSTTPYDGQSMNLSVNEYEFQSHREKS